MVNDSLETLLNECARLHGHLCPGHVLGGRMALQGCRLLGLEDPRGAYRKKFLVWVEIDRCMTDAVSAVTGATLGKRSLKFVDYGKGSATFLNLELNRAVRITALDAARGLADARYPSEPSRKERQMRAYRTALDGELFKVQNVSVALDDFDLPGRPRSRVTCLKCLEGVNDGRELKTEGGEVLCCPCASEGYYTPTDEDDHEGDRVR